MSNINDLNTTSEIKRGDKFYLGRGNDDFSADGSLIALPKIQSNAFVYPSWWSGVKIPVNVSDGKAVYNYDIGGKFDLDDYTPYYVSPTGNDANDGLTKATAKKSVQNVVSIGGELVYMLPGVYTRDTLPFATTDITGSDLIVIGIGDVYISQAEEGLSWTLTNNSTYTTVRTATVGVVDTTFFNDYGYFKELDFADSQADCEANAGTWYTDGTNVWVHNIDGRIPDTNNLICLNITAGATNNNGNVYFKNINLIYIELQVQGVNSSSTLNIYCEDVTNVYEQFLPYKNNFSLDDFKLCVMKNCLSLNAGRDGFNYHNVAGVTDSTAIELDCQGLNLVTGDSGTSNQTSTAHEGIKMLRLNGNYVGGKSQIIADVNPGAETIMVGSNLSTFNNLPNVLFYGADAVLESVRLIGNKQITCVDDVNGGILIRNSIVDYSITNGNVTIQ